jgi:dienelactone hydrolase
MRKLVLVSVIFGSLLAASGAQAAIPSALGVTCSVAADGVRECGTGSSSGDTVRSTSPTWDGTPIDVNIAFPPVPSGTDGNYPLIIYGHGYGGEKLDFGASGSTDGMRQFTSRGYAVFSMTDRGFHQSCGKDNAIAAAPAGACDNGFVHLMDDRYEVRDAQFFAGELADEGLVSSQRIGATGASYGGGLSLALASLKDRVMMPSGQLVPWTSPSLHIPMQVAAAVPIVPWSDLVYSLTPNGGTLDYVADSPYGGRIGIEKQSLVGGLYLSGSGTGKYCGVAPLPSPCPDPEADLTAWKTRLDAGEPFDGDPLVSSIFNEITTHHSAYYIDHSEQPSPLLIANGFTDDLFPADEAIRFYNRIRSLYPSAPLSLFFGDFGHPRAAQNKSPETGDLTAATLAWLDHYVKGSGSQPFQGTTAYAMTCPTTAHSGGPFQAGSWAGLQRGEVRLDSPAAQVIAPDGGSSTVNATWNPVSQDPCTSASAADQSGVATYRLPAAAGSGYTLMGSPTVVATINSPTANSEVAARLLDVDPSGTETLVDRQLFRPAVGSARQVFQLHPSGHLFAPGHIAKLELLPNDAGGLLGGYGHAANGQGQVTVSKLSLRIPTLDGPGASGGQVIAASPLLLPCGAAIAPEFSSVSYLRASLGEGKVRFKGRTGKVPVDSAPGPNPCLVQVKLLGSGRGTSVRSAKKHKKKKKKKANVLGKGSTTIPGGQSATVKLKLSKHGRDAVRRGRGVRVQVTTMDAAGNTVQTAKVNFKKKHGKGKHHKGKHHKGKHHKR